MSRSRSKRTSPKYQRAKLLVLPILLAVLGYVLLADSGSDEDEVAFVPAPVDASRHNPPQAGSAPQAASKSKLPDWSDLASQHRAELNPFLPIAKEEAEPAPPKTVDPLQPVDVRPDDNNRDAAIAAAQPAAQPLADAADVKALSQQPVRYFFQTNNRRVMLVGERLLSEGQTINSYTVTHLEPNRIELEPTAPKP